MGSWPARRAATNTSTTSRMAVIAASEFRTVAAIATACSVKAQGRLRAPPRPGFEVAIYIKAASSSAASWKA